MKPRKKSETAVKSSHKKADIRLELSDILDALPFYVMLVDEQHNILQANKAVETQLGMDPYDIIGKYCPSVIHGLESPIEGCPLEEAAEKNQVVERELYDEKSRCWIVSSIYPTRGSTADGKRIFFHMVSDITARKQAEDRLKASQDQLRDLSRHLESIREEERAKLAREIHDELGQMLTGLKIDIAWISRRIPREEKPLVAKVKSMDELIDNATKTTQRISAELRPGVLDYLGLVPAIDWLIQDLGKRTEIKFDFKTSPREISLDRERATALFRICQEALTNVIRHAHATWVKITLKKDSDRIILVVKDNGKGISEEQISDPKSFGLIGMRERARSYRGDVKISSTPRRGTSVAASFPLMVSESE
jgi:PAS domain S-box-containing protein